MLSENRRKQLDDIVGQMSANNEKDADIQFVVDDFQNKYKSEAAPVSNPPIPAGRGMGDLRMAESPMGAKGVSHAQALDNSNKMDYPMSYGVLPNDVKMNITPGMQRTAGQFVAPAKFAGDVGVLATTGIPNAIAQAVQDKGIAPWQITKNVGKEILTPAANLIGKPFQNPIQDSRTSFARAGFSDAPQTIYGTSDAGLYSGLTGGVPARGSQGQQLRGTGIESAGPAEMLGTFADVATPVLPLVGIDAIKAAGAAGRAGLAKIADPIGKGLQEAGLSQMNKVVSPLMRHERKARTPISDVIFKYKFDVPQAGDVAKGADTETMFQRSGDKLKELSQQLKQNIQQGADNGARIDVHDVIDQAVKELKDKRGETPDFYKYIKEMDAASNDLKESVALASDSKNGSLDLLQSQGIKQYTGAQGKWLQYARNKGIPTTAKETAESILAESVNRKLNGMIDDLATGSTADINKQISEIIPAHEALGWRQIVDNRKAKFSLGDVIGITATALDPKLAVLYGINKASKSGKVASWMYRLGEKLRAAKTPEETNRAVTAMKKMGMTEPQIQGIQEATPDMFEGLKFGEPKPTTPAQPDPLEAMDPRSRQALPQGQGGLEDMAPPEMVQARQQAGQASREAYVRQGRERALDIPGKPFQSNQGPQLKVIPRPPPKRLTQGEIFGPSDMRYRRDQMYKYLKETTGKDPWMKDVYSELDKLGRKDVPKIPIKEKAEWKNKPKRNNHTLYEEEQLIHAGDPSWPTETIRAEDAPKTFMVGGREYTKGRTLYGKTLFKDDKGRKHLFKNDELVHMDPKNSQDEIPF